MDLRTAFLILVIYKDCFTCSVNDEDRIVGGIPSSINCHPSIVQIEFFTAWNQLWTQSCAGSILKSNYVVSAAHCFSGAFYLGPQYRRIRAGTTYREKGGTIVNVKSVLIHPTYGQQGFDGDISLVRLATFLTFSAVIQQVQIVGQGVHIPDGLPVVYAGWGTMSEGGPLSSVLLDVTIFTINNQICAKIYRDVQETVTKNMICTGVLRVGGRDACQGDSGGPLYFGDILIGVISWGRGCANKSYPGVSTAVGSYTNWLAANV